MDPLSTLHTAAKLVIELANAVSEVDQNRTKCVNLGRRVKRLLPFVHAHYEQEQRGSGKLMDGSMVELQRILDACAEKIGSIVKPAKEGVMGRAMRIFHETTNRKEFAASLVSLGTELDSISIEIGVFGSKEAHNLIQKQNLSPQGLDSVYVEVPKAAGVSDKNLSASAVLGRGTFCVMYRVVNTGSGVCYAKKKIDVAEAAERNVTESELVRECKILESLAHPHIARYFAFYFSEEKKYFNIIMELIEDGTLAKQVTANPAPAEAQILEWARQMASALAYMHSERVLHRDLKPENIMLTAKSKIKIIDLGLACVVTSASGEMTMGVGTGRYASHEKWNTRGYDERDDVWAMGCVLLELLTRLRLPVEGYISDPSNPAVAKHRDSLVAVATKTSPFLGKIILPKMLVPQNARITSVQLVGVLASPHPLQGSGAAAPAVVYPAIQQAGTAVPLTPLGVPVYKRLSIQARKKISGFFSAATTWQLLLGAVGAAVVALLVAYSRGWTGEVPTMPSLSSPLSFLSGGGDAAKFSWKSSGQPVALSVPTQTRVDEVLRLLDSGSPVEVESAASKLRGLAGSSAGRTSLASSHAVRISLGVLSSGDASAAAQADLAAMVAAVALNTTDAALIVAAGGVPVLAKLAYGTGPVQEQAALALQNLVAFPAGATDFAAAEHWPALLHLFRHGAQPAVRSAIRILQYVAADVQCVEPILNAGLLDPLMKLLSSNVTEFQTSAAVVLDTFAVSTKAARGLAVAGAAPALVQVLRNGFPEAKSRAVSALQRVVPHLGNGTAPISAEGFLLLSAHLYIGDAESKVNTMRLVGKLLANSSLAAPLADAGIVAPLVEILSAGPPKSCEWATSVLLPLVVDPTGVRKLSREAPVPALLHVFRSGTEVARSNTAAILGVLASDTDVRNAISAAGATADLQRALAAGGGYLSREQVEIATWNLIADSLDAISMPESVQGLRSADEDERERAAVLLETYSSQALYRRPIVTAGAVPALVRMLHDGRPVAKELALSVLVNLADVLERRKEIVVAGAFTPLVLLLERGTDGAKEHAAGLLRRLVNGADDGSVAAAAMAVEPLVKLLAHSAAAVQEEAAGALAAVATSAESKAAAGALGAVSLLVEVLASGTQGAKEKAAAALTCLSTDSENKSKTVNAKVLAAVVDMMTHGTDGAKEQAARLLDSVTDAAGWPQVVRAGAISPIVGLLRTGTPAAQETAVDLFLRCSTDVDARGNISTKDAILPLVRVLGSGTVSARSNAAETLQNLAFSSNATKLIISGAGAVPLLGRMLVDGTESARASAEAALWSLIQGSAAKDAAPAMELLLSHGSQEAQEKVAKQVKDAAATAGDKAYLIGCLPPLVRLLGSGTDLAKQLAAEALFQLASEAQYRKSMVAEHAIPKLVRLLTGGAGQCKVSATGVLLRLSADVENVSLIGSTVSTPTLVQLLVGGDEDTKANIAGIFQNLAASPDTRKKTAAALPSLVQLLKHGTDSAKTHAAGAVGNLCQDASILKTLSAKPAIHALTALLKSTMDSVRAPAARALGILAADHENCKLILEAVAIPLLVQMLGHGTAAGPEAAAAALGKLVQAPEILQGVDPKIFVAPLVTLLRDGSASAKSQAAILLSRLATASAHRAAFAARADEIIPLLTGQLLKVTDASTHASAAFRALSQDSAFAKKLASAYAVTELMLLLVSGAETAREHAAETLLMLPLNATQWNELATPSGISSLLPALADGTPVQREYAAGLLSRLTADPRKLRMIWLSGAVPHLEAHRWSGSERAKKFASVALDALHKTWHGRIYWVLGWPFLLPVVAVAALSGGDPFHAIDKQEILGIFWFALHFQIAPDFTTVWQFTVHLFWYLILPLGVLLPLVVNLLFRPFISPFDAAGAYVLVTTLATVAGCILRWVWWCITGV